MQQFDNIYKMNNDTKLITLLMELRKRNLKTSYHKPGPYFEKYRRELQKYSKMMSQTERVTTNPQPNPEQPPIKVEQTKMTYSIKLPLQIPKLDRNNATQSSIQKTSSVLSQQSSEEHHEAARENLEMKREIENLMVTYDELQQSLIKMQAEMEEKRRVMEGLRNLVHQENQNFSPRQEMSNYSEQVFMIEEKMKGKKRIHEQELQKLVDQKELRHSQNLELCKQMEELEEKVLEMRKRAQESEKNESFANLQKREEQLRLGVERLGLQCEQMELKAGDSSEVKELSYQTFKRYGEIYQKIIIGKQISRVEEIINQKNSPSKISAQIQRRKILLKDKKVEVLLREKAVLQANKIAEAIGKDIKSFSLQLMNLNSEKKSVFLSKDIDELDRND